MANHKVRAGQQYIFYPNFLDKFEGRTGLTPGAIVKVITIHGAPAANVMGHAYIGDKEDGKFIGMVHTNSLYSMSDSKLVIDAIKKDYAKKLEAA